MKVDSHLPNIKKIKLILIEKSKEKMPHHYIIFYAKFMPLKINILNFFIKNVNKSQIRMLDFKFNRRMKL